MNVGLGIWLQNPIMYQWPSNTTSIVLYSFLTGYNSCIREAASKFFTRSGSGKITGYPTRSVAANASSDSGRLPVASSLSGLF